VDQVVEHLPSKQSPVPPKEKREGEWEEKKKREEEVGGGGGEEEEEEECSKHLVFPSSCNDCPLSASLSSFLLSLESPPTSHQLTKSSASTRPSLSPYSHSDPFPIIQQRSPPFSELLNILN
jgi:hypothetical protein